MLEQRVGESSACASHLESTYHLLSIKVIPSVDLKISIGFTQLLFHLIFVNSNHEFFLIVSVIIRGIKNKANFGAFPPVFLSPLKIKDYISIEIKCISWKDMTYLELFFGTASLNCSKVSSLAPVFSTSTPSIASLIL